MGGETRGIVRVYKPIYEDTLGGGPAGFRDLVNEAHRRGIAVLIDVVYNRLSDSAGDMWQFDGWSLPYGMGGNVKCVNVCVTTPCADSFCPVLIAADLRS